MTITEIDSIVDQYGKLYRPFIGVEDAAEIAQIPIATVHDWSSRGLLDGFKSKQGRRVRFSRDAFVRFLCGQFRKSSRSST